MWWLWIILIIVVLLIFITIYYYNRFVVLHNRIENAYSQIDVQLKKRNDLVPNLVETVKGYAKHEKGVFSDVTKARKEMMAAGSFEGKMQASDMMTNALKSIFALAENYPDLKANTNFLELQRELSDIESKLAYTRQFYNDSILYFNTLVERFPSNLFAKMFGKDKQNYFETKEAERKNVKVSF